MLARCLTPHVAGVAAAGTAFDLHAGRPDDEVGRGWIHLAPGDLIDGCPYLTHRGHGFFHHYKETQRSAVTDTQLERVVRHKLSIWRIN